MADNFNHANELVSWGLLNTKMHMTAKPEDTYFHTERFMNNFSVLYANESLSELSLEQRVNAKKNIKGYFDRTQFEKNNSKYSLETWKKQCKERDLWEIAYIW
jgi:hypothetical protein